jgi:hypothetical protein
MFLPQAVRSGSTEVCFHGNHSLSSEGRRRQVPAVYPIAMLDTLTCGQQKGDGTIRRYENRVTSRIQAAVERYRRNSHEQRPAYKPKTNLVAFGPQANSTDREAATCQLSCWKHLRVEGVAWSE